MITPLVVYDTNVFIQYADQVRERSHLLSAIVVQELAMGAGDDKRLRELDRWWRRYEAEQRVLVPNVEDWYAAGRILNLLRRGRKSHRHGHVSAIPREEQQRLLRDVLIARTAKRAGAVVVTADAGDFRKIRRFCDVLTVDPNTFF